ncbi:MAG: CotH kinase family protein [Bacillota bacterium]|nr:CotH kinase family protein [Bacillota bacterium]
MSTNKHIDKICIIVVAITLIITILFMNGSSIGIAIADRVMGYETRLFSTDRVHTIDIVMNDWDSFIATCENEEYEVCNVIIDGEKCKNVGIRAKGNTSLSSVKSMGSERYSVKIEFDQYEKGENYHGLDKLCLNNLSQDNTMMKDYLSYVMMNDFGVDSPLCSYAYVTVNGEDWGLYLAVEGIEDSFLERNYGSNAGELYKPDSMNFGGGRGNGKDFDMGDFDFDFDSDSFEFEQMPPMPQRPEGFDGQNMPQIPGGGQMPGGFGGMGSADVKLQYIDDDPDSYPNIFDSAKTDVSKADKKRLISSLKNLSEYTDLENTLDIDEVLRYFVVHNFVVNGDSYTGSMIHNYYLHESGGKLAMIPWDYNLAFGTFQGGNASNAINDSIDEVLSDRPMQAWIFSDEQYTNQYHALYSEFIEKWFANGELEKLIADTAEMIRPYVEKDPTKFCTAEEFDAGVQTIKQFVSLRAEAVSRQLSGNTTAVETGDLNLSTMGSMGGMGGKGGQFDRDDMKGKDGQFDWKDMDGKMPERK